jgi:hypothetical protein
MFVLYYVGLKAAFLYGLVHSFVKYETLQEHWLFMASLYVGGIAVLSGVFIMAPMESPDWWGWELWLAKSLLLAAVYFRLLRRFDEGMMFWLLLIAGLGLVYY